MSDHDTDALTAHLDALLPDADWRIGVDAEFLPRVPLTLPAPLGATPTRLASMAEHRRLTRLHALTEAMLVLEKAIAACMDNKDLPGPQDDPELTGDIEALHATIAGTAHPESALSLIGEGDAFAPGLLARLGNHIPLLLLRRGQ